MPRAPRKCNHEGCEARGNTPYCPEHTPINWGKGNQRASTKEHRDWRKAVLDRDKWQCQTRGPGCTGRATQSDHIIPVAEGGQTILANGAAICVTCHKRKTSIEAARGRARSNQYTRD